jgi:hypothetical protein
MLAACCFAFAGPLMAADDTPPKSSVHLAFDKNAWTFTTSGGRAALEYCPVASPLKPYVKKLYTPGGVQVLRDSPFDHKHHHALMFALSANGVTFWEETAGCGKQVPREDRTSEDLLYGEILSHCFIHTLDWVDTHGKKLLVEKRTVGLVLAPPQRVTLVTWSSELSPAEGLASVMLGGHHYYGLGMRFLTSMDTGGRFFESSGKPGEVVHGSEQLVPAKWCAYTAKADGKPVTVAIFDRPSNPRHPNKMFTMTTPFAYLSATLNLWKEPLVLKAGEKLKLTYAVDLWDGEVAAEQVESLYQKWVAMK